MIFAFLFGIIGFVLELLAIVIFFTGLIEANASTPFIGFAILAGVFFVIGWFLRFRSKHTVKAI